MTTTDMEGSDSDLFSGRIAQNLFGGGSDITLRKPLVRVTRF
jgi:hypothetical protein